eukprot:UN17577
MICWIVKVHFFLLMTLEDDNYIYVVHYEEGKLKLGKKFNINITGDNHVSFTMKSIQSNNKDEILVRTGTGRVILLDYSGNQKQNYYDDLIRNVT